MKPKYIIIHHTGGSDANPLQDSSNFSFNECNELHRINFNFKSSLGYYCGYQYYIEKDGKFYKAREDDEEGVHTIGKNKESIGICLAGNFDYSIPTLAQKSALTDLLFKKTAQWSIPIENVVPHRKFSIKTCFGNKLSDDWAQQLLKTKINTTPTPSQPGDKIKEAIALIEKAVILLKSTS